MKFASACVSPDVTGSGWGAPAPPASVTPNCSGRRRIHGRYRTESQSLGVTQVMKGMAPWTASLGDLAVLFGDGAEHEHLRP